MIKVSKDHLTINLKVIPQAGRQEIAGIQGDSLKIKILSAPEKGKANQEIITLFAKLLKLPKANLEIISGMTSPHKVLKIVGISQADLLKKLPVSIE